MELSLILKGCLTNKKYNPSIEYLELFALTAAVLTWGSKLKNRRITIFCDNLSVVCMINNDKVTSSEWTS